MTDILAEYSRLHSEVPETRPVSGTNRLEIYDNSYGKFKATWIGDYIDVEDAYPLDFEVIPVCRCAALEWAHKMVYVLHKARIGHLHSLNVHLWTWLVGASTAHPTTSN